MVDVSRWCEVLVGLGPDVRVLGVEELDDSLVVRVETASGKVVVCGRCGRSAGSKGRLPVVYVICLVLVVRLGLCG
jgi:hypothetical protein